MFTTGICSSLLTLGYVLPRSNYSSLIINVHGRVCLAQHIILRQVIIGHETDACSASKHVAEVRRKTVSMATISKQFS